MGVDFADYDNDGHRRHHRHRPLERTLHVVPPERRRQLPRRDEPDRRRRRHAAVLGVEHALLRLRQRWLEGLVRCPGARDGHHREDLAELEVSAAAAAACGTRRGVSSGSWPGDAFRKEWAGRGAAFGDLDNDGDTDVVVSNVGQKAYVLRNDGGNRGNWLGIRTVRHEIESRRDRQPASKS